MKTSDRRKRDINEFAAKFRKNAGLKGRLIENRRMPYSPRGRIMAYVLDGRRARKITFTYNTTNGIFYGAWYEANIASTERGQAHLLDSGLVTKLIELPERPDNLNAVPTRGRNRIQNGLQILCNSVEHGLPYEHPDAWENAAIYVGKVDKVIAEYMKKQ